MHTGRVRTALPYGTAIIKPLSLTVHVHSQRQYKQMHTYRRDRVRYSNQTVLLFPQSQSQNTSPVGAFCLHRHSLCSLPLCMRKVRQQTSAYRRVSVA
jgi:hypothetical protein